MLSTSFEEEIKRLKPRMKRVMKVSGDVAGEFESFNYVQDHLKKETVASNRMLDLL